MCFAKCDIKIFINTRCVHSARTITPRIAARAQGTPAQHFLKQICRPCLGEIKKIAFIVFFPEILHT